MKGVKYASTVAEFDLDAENCGAEVQIIDQDGHQWISLVIDGGEITLSLTPEDTRNLTRAFQQARLAII